jgi:tetratricopeptide (TPR) repeat protein
VKALRFLGVGVIAALAAWAIYALAWRPLQCNALVQALSDSSYAGYETRNFTDLDAARRNLDTIQPCMTAGCRSVGILFLAAVNYRTIGRNEVALGLYQQALRYDRRPEIYTNIGDTYFTLGDREKAYDNYLTAALFHPEWLRFIDDGAMRVRVRDAVLEKYPEQRQFIEWLDRVRTN